MDMLARRDHRIDIGLRKRTQMRARILLATREAFSQAGTQRPVIQDVVRHARVSRGAFYEHFDTLDQAFLATGRHLLADLSRQVLPVYDVLKEPWQRLAVGCRAFLLGACAGDPLWCQFTTRAEAWRSEPFVVKFIAEDLRRGKAAGQFRVDDLDVAISFLVGGSAGVVLALRSESDPERRIDAVLQLLLRGLECDAALSDKAIAFSRNHLAVWHGWLALAPPLSLQPDK